MAKNFSWSALLFCASLLPDMLIPHSASAQTYPSQPVIVGYRDFGYGTEVFKTPTAEKPQSKLWWNDGIWWGCLWDPVASAYRIHRFDIATQSWTNVGPDIDDRANTLADALWEGQYLYVASHVRASPGGPARLYRYSYAAATKSYSLDAGFPVNISNETCEALTIAKDSKGKLWITWEANNKIMVNRTIGDDWTWGAPFQLPVQGAAVTGDDIAAIVAMNGNKIGIMWSNQNDLKMYFAVHQDNKNDLDWDMREKAVEDPILGAIADDHINLKLTSDNGGAIYAVTKTSLSNDNDPLILFLKRNSGGVWTRETVWTKGENHTRPTLLIDNENKKVYVFAMSGKNGSQTIYTKSTSLSNPQFPQGMGTVFIQSATDVDVDNVSSTKQNLNSTTGLLVVVGDEVTRNYLHNYMTIARNLPPVAVNDAATTDEDTPVTIDVTANDTDIDGTVDVTTVAIVASATNGATAVNATTGVVTYTPNPNYFGVDTFTYTVEDDKRVTSNVATVTVTVNEVNDGNDPPVAVNDAAATSVNTPVNISVTDNDTDSDGTVDVTTVAIVASPTNGTTAVNATTGVVTYTPNPNYFGVDTFTYTVNDDQGATSNVATATVTVNDVNDPPVAVNDAATTGEDTPVTIDVTGNDTDTDGTVDVTTVTIVASATNGATAVNATTGVVTYTPNPNYFGVDTFTYTVKDDQGATSSVATVTVTVNEVNDPPVAVNDATSTNQNTSVNVSVTGNDTDPDGTIDVTTVAIAAGPGNGAATINPATGVVSYTPNAGYAGNDAFTYTVKDDDGAPSNAATVTINVIATGLITQSFQPIADAYVKSTNPTTKYGSESTLQLRNGNPTQNSYLKFQVTQITGQVQSAKLRLYVTDSSPDGGSIYLVSDNYLNTNTPWNESGLSWSTAPTISGTPLSSVSAPTSKTWVELDVTAAITGNGIYSLGLRSNSTNSVYYSSKEGANKPQLVVNFVSGTLVTPIVTSFSPASGTANTEVTITGSHFFGANGVAFNGTAATFNVDSDTQIRAIVPAGATTGKISVTNTVGTGFSAQNFTVPILITLNPIDDAQVKSSSPTTNYGADNSFRLRSGSPTYNSYLKFQVTQITGQVLSAKLRLYVTTSSPDGGSVYLVSNNYLGTITPWNEENLIWNNAPAINGTTLGAIGAANSNTWVELDVTAAIAGNGIYSFGLKSGSTSSVIYSSKEAAARWPELVIVMNGMAKTSNHAPLAENGNMENAASLPERFGLSPNYPNPFNIQTIIQYALPVEGKVQLVIYNLMGQKVRTLVDEIQPAGYKQVHWDGHDQYGSVAGSGIYLVRLQAGQQSFTRRITLLK